MKWKDETLNEFKIISKKKKIEQEILENKSIFIFVSIFLFITSKQVKKKIL